MRHKVLILPPSLRGCASYEPALHTMYNRTLICLPALTPVTYSEENQFSVSHLYLHPPFSYFFTDLPARLISLIRPPTFPTPLLLSLGCDFTPLGRCIRLDVRCVLEFLFTSCTVRQIVISAPLLDLPDFLRSLPLHLSDASYCPPDGHVTYFPSLI